MTNSKNTANIYAEIITIGDEILYGQITDTNSQWMSSELDKIGIKIKRQSSVGDEAEDILEALKEAEKRVDLILITGGLGPTKDDITKKTLARFFDVEMVLHEPALQAIEAYFARFGRVANEVNLNLAYIPANARYMTNNAGTAPGMWFEKDGKVFVSMPGVPIEMKTLMQDHILGALQKHFNSPVIYHKVIRTVGLGESMIAEKIEHLEDTLPPHLKLAYLPDFGQVKVRLTGTGSSLGEIQSEVDSKIAEIVALLPKNVFGYDKEELEEVVGHLLKTQGKSVATAESCTGGYLAHLFSKVPGSSGYYKGSVVAYSNEVKAGVLGVKPDTLTQFGAVSQETVEQMAEGVRRILNTDVGLATSGVVGPGGGSPEKPVGTVWIAYADEKQTYSKELMLTPHRLINIQLAALTTLDLLRRKLSGI